MTKQNYIQNISKATVGFNFSRSIAVVFLFSKFNFTYSNIASSNTDTCGSDFIESKTKSVGIELVYIYRRECAKCLSKIQALIKKSTWSLMSESLNDKLDLKSCNGKPESRALMAGMGTVQIFSGQNIIY